MGIGFVFAELLKIAEGAGIIEGEVLVSRKRGIGSKEVYMEGY